MTPPSIESAVELLTSAASQARASGDPVAGLAAAAIDVVLAALDQRAAPAPCDFKSEPAYKLGPDVVSATTRRIGRPVRRREEEIAASRAIGYADRSYAVRAAMLLRDEGLAKELPDRGDPAIATACAPTALTIVMQEVDRQMERALDEHRNAPTAYRAGGGPAVSAISDARLREIANGVDIEIGPWAETGDAERFAAELHTMAAELLHLRAEIAAIASAAGGDRGSDERLSEYVTRLQDRAALAERNYAEQQAITDRAHALRCHEEHGRLRTAAQGYLASALRSLLDDLGLAPSGTGSENLGILELEIKRLRAPK